MSASGSSLFGSGTKTQNSQATTSNTTTTLETINRNISGNSGIVASEGSSVDYDNRSYIDNHPITISTDAGAVESGARVANAGISAGVTIAAQSTGALHDLAADAVMRASALSERSLDIVDATTHDAQAAARSYAEGTTDFAGRVLTQFGKTLSDYQLAEQAQLGNVVSALSASFVDNTKTADQRVTDATLQAGAQSAGVITSVAKYAAIAIAVGFVGYIILKKA